MTVSELKLELFKKIALLNQPELEQIYDLIQKITGKDTSNQWEALSAQQQQGILSALEEMNQSEGIAHQAVMDKFKQKYA